MKLRLVDRAGIVLVAIIVATAIIVGLRSPSVGAKAPRVDAELNGWSYQYSVPTADADGDYGIVVKYPKGSASDVRAAAAAMNGYASQLAQADVTFQATIVFGRPLDAEEFGDFVATTGLAPTGSIIRARQPDGQRVTLGVPPVWSEDDRGRRRFGQPRVGQPALDLGALERLRQRRPENAILGVVSTTATVDAAILRRLQADQRVFAVDILEHVITGTVRSQFPQVAPAKINVQSSQLYWAMEDMGLVAAR